MTTSSLSFGARLLRAFRNLVRSTLIVGLAGASLWALSVLNSRTWTLEVRDGRLVVMKGRTLPWGFEPWQPTDPALVDAYAPLELEGNTALAVAGSRLADRDEVDRALFVIIELIARPRVISDAPVELEKGLTLLRRAERLRGLTDEQRLSLKRMQADVAFYLARTRLEDARKQLEEALVQLKFAADADTRHAREASQMLLTVEPPTKALSDTLRAAVYQLSAPAPKPPPRVEPVAAPDAGVELDAGVLGDDARFLH